MDETDAELIAHLRRYSEGCDPSSVLEAADRIEALAARVAVLEGALRGIAEAKITFDYVTLVRNADGTIDSEAPASPYDRGKAEGYREAADIARAALTA